ncbi:hypothetical protein [Cellulomonas sp. WB94]|uniref:hypothetical protein n=1 Tax=Cellulomonas sp. WB94 TaxID=2173174 RepID=UPI001F5BC268|nr:hypothetical protein [Cellulomonas sp. WB94]
MARRGAAARRRAVLAVTLLVASIAGWAVTGLTAVTVAAGIVPSVLFVGVLVLGRRAVVAGHAADVEWERRRREHALAPARASAHAPAVTGRAVRPSDSHTEVFARILDQVDGVPSAATSDASTVVRRSTRQGAQADGESAEDEWSPVPVPRPTYTLKSPAPRREPAPLGEVEGSTEMRAPAEAPAAVVEPPAGTTGSINLDEVLARRRAAGE